MSKYSEATSPRTGNPMRHSESIATKSRLKVSFIFYGVVARTDVFSQNVFNIEPNFTRNITVAIRITT